MLAQGERSRFGIGQFLGGETVFACELQFFHKNRFKPGNIGWCCCCRGAEYAAPVEIRHRQRRAHAVAEPFLAANAFSEARIQSRAAAENIVGQRQRRIRRVVFNHLNEHLRLKYRVLLIRCLDGFVDSCDLAVRVLNAFVGKGTFPVAKQRLDHRLDGSLLKITNDGDLGNRKSTEIPMCKTKLL